MYFPLQPTEGTSSPGMSTSHPSGFTSRLKILTPKQMLKRLPIALAQVKAGNTSEKALNEIRQIIYSFYRANEITKKVNDNITNSVKL